MATGADADAWAKEFGYPLEADTGDISLGSIMDELRANDPAARFMLEVYDHIVAAKGGAGSESAAAFLTNFMPPNSATGDEREHYCKLVYGDEVILHTATTQHGSYSHTQVKQADGSSSHIQHLPNLLSNEVLITASPKETVSSSSGFASSTASRTLTPAEAAQSIIANVEAVNDMKPWVDWLIFGANILLIAVGCGAAVGALRLAATAGARLAASTVLAFEVSEATEFISGYIGGKAKGYNPLKEAFRWAGKNADGASGADRAEHVYNTLNIVVGFGGKIGLLAGSTYAVAMEGKASKPSCQGIEGALTEEPLASQGDAQKTVFKW